MTNKYLKKFPSFSLKPYTVKHDERKHMVKLCRRKLKNLQNKGTISVKSVLIKNTLKVMEKQNLLDHFDKCALSTLINKLQSMQNKVIRYMTNIPQSISVEQKFKHLNILNIENYFLLCPPKVNP